MTSSLWTLEEFLQFRCPAQTAWSTDGTCLAFVMQGADQDALWLISADGLGAMQPLPSLSVADSSTGKMWGSVQSAYVWCPNAFAVLRVADGIWMHDLRTGEQKHLTRGEQSESHPSWSPDGRCFAFRRGERVAFYELATSFLVSIPAPGRVYEFAPHLTWSPDGKLIAVAWRRADAPGQPARRGLDIAVLSPRNGVVWATDTLGTIAHPQWLDREQLLLTRYNETHTVAEHVLIQIPTGTERVLLTVEEPKGLQPDFVEGLGTRGPILSPDRKEAILIQAVEGWDHLHLLDLKTGTLKRLTSGQCEDSSPRWSPDGRRIAYFSNGHPSLSSLDVQVYNRDNGALQVLTSLPGAKDELTWSPDGRRLAFLHAGPGKPPGVWVGQVGNLSYNRLTQPWPEDSTWRNDVPPQEVWIEATDGHRTPGLLYTRPDAHDGPAIIWLHGGPGMQYYQGWPTDYGSCLHHAFHQLLVQRGYSVLYLNYRGSTGYGVEHQQGNYLKLGVAETADVAGAAHWLSSLPQVSGERLCVAGRSYGGFAALSALARLPGLFRLGIVIAGFGDLSSSLDESGQDFWDDTTCFRWRMGWSPNQHPQAWRTANVLPDLEQLQAPLVIFHGERDQAVYVEEARKIEQRCRNLGKRCFAHYYAGEDHVFSMAETWQDVFARTLTYLCDFVE
jgi:dipeptidyl aminopeptidase/acylaminoacyl peptidase